MTTPIPDVLAASCRAFALQLKPFGVSDVLNDAADLIQQQQADIERLFAALEQVAEWRVNGAPDKWVEIREEMRTLVRLVLGKDEKE